MDVQKVLVFPLCSEMHFLVGSNIFSTCLETYYLVPFSSEFLRNPEKWEYKPSALDEYLLLVRYILLIFFFLSSTEINLNENLVF